MLVFEVGGDCVSHVIGDLMCSTSPNPEPKIAPSVEAFEETENLYCPL
jgi:hypothetical protein